MSTLPCRCIKTFTVILLDGRTLQIQVGAKATYYDVFEKACLSIGLTGTQVFGLAFKSADDAFYFVDLSDVVSRPSARLGRSLHLADTGAMYLRVQYYVTYLGSLKDHTARHFYYLQLKENFVRYSYECTEEHCFLMAAYALRADFGAYNADQHVGSYFDPSQYFPKWVIEKYGAAFIVKHMPSIHADLSHVRRDEAKHTYMLELCADLPASYNLHLYRLRWRRTDHAHDRLQDTCSVFLGLSPQGLELFEPSRKNFITRTSTYPWWSIERVMCEKQKLKLVFSHTSHGRKLELYTPSSEWAKYLLWLIQRVHQVRMGMQNQEAEDSASSLLKFSALSDRRQYRESYIHSDVADLEWEHEQSLVGDLLRLSCSQQLHQHADNRVSVISNGSSNTTSGVVSDKLHISFDESDGDDAYPRTTGGKPLVKELVSSSTRTPKDGFSRPSELMRKEPSADSVLEASQKVARYLSTAVSDPPKGAAFHCTIDGHAASDNACCFAPSAAAAAASTGKTVQRATSDPSKQQSEIPRGTSILHGSLCRQRRAVSDNELSLSSLAASHVRQESEHIYENITVYRRLSSAPAYTCQEMNTAVCGSGCSSSDDYSIDPSRMVTHSMTSVGNSSDDLKALPSANCLARSAPSPGAMLVNQPSAIDTCLVNLPPPPSYAAAQLQKQLRLLSSSGNASAPSATVAALPAAVPAPAAVRYTPDAAGAAPTVSQPVAAQQQHCLQKVISPVRMSEGGPTRDGIAALLTSASAEHISQCTLLSPSNLPSAWKIPNHSSRARSHEMYASAGVLDANQNFATSRNAGDYYRPECPLHNHKKSHPDINKLRDMSHDLSLPLIAGLCNDKHLTASMEACTCIGLDNDDDHCPSSDWRLPQPSFPENCEAIAWSGSRQKHRHHVAEERPMSWHCGSENAWRDVLLTRSAAGTTSEASGAPERPVPRARARTQPSIDGSQAFGGSSSSAEATTAYFVPRSEAFARLMV